MTNGHYILAIDQGTSSTRALVVGASGEVLGRGQRSVDCRYPTPGWIEQDPAALWVSVQEATGVALAAAGVRASELSAIGIANQRETALVWDRATGEPLSPALNWQDRRGAAICEELRLAGHEAAVVRSTGLTLDPYFSATKLAWFLRGRPDLRQRGERGELAAGTVDSWLIWNLTAGQRFVTDYTNASRTLLFNIRTGRWDDSLCELFGVPRAMLPQPQPSRSAFAFSDEGSIGARVPILGVAGDQQAALYGQACHEPGQAKNTYGTGCFLLANAGPRPIQSANRLLVSIGAMAGPGGPDYVIEGSVFTAGALLEWLCTRFRLAPTPAALGALAATVPDAGGVQIVPAFAGLGAPDWDPHARGAILGLTGGATGAHIARAAIEAIALSSAELLHALNRDLGIPVDELRADGGLARDDLLLQLQADYSGIPVVRPKEIETTAMGAAYLAGEGTGAWESREEVAAMWHAEHTFAPAIGEGERDERLRDWRRAVDRTRGWPR